MVFHPYQKDISKLIPSLIINGIELERVDHIKCLCVILDENMSWKPHLDILANKISKYTGILNKLKHHLAIDTLRTLYFSMINSNLNYSILVWGFCCQRLIKLQKKAIIISRSKYNAHTGPIFKILDILTLDEGAIWPSLSPCTVINPILLTYTGWSVQLKRFKILLQIYPRYPASLCLFF